MELHAPIHRLPGFTPLKLAQVIWPQPRTKGLSPFPLTTTERREGNAGYEVVLARY